MPLGTDVFKRGTNMLGPLLEISAKAGDRIAAGKSNGAANHQGGKHNLLHKFLLEYAAHGGLSFQFNSLEDVSLEISAF